MGLKTLWSREYTQTKLFVWLVPAVHFFFLGFGRLNEWILNYGLHAERWVELLNSRDVVQYYQYGALESKGRAWMLAAVIVLALVQFGMERRNGGQEFLFSLPYSRRQIFTAKWLFGSALIAGTFTLNTLIDAMVILASPTAELFNLGYHLEQWLYSIVLIAAVYSFVVLIGTVTGAVWSQAAISALLWMVPAAVYTVLDDSIRHLWNDNFLYGGVTYNTLVKLRFIPFYIFIDYEWITWGNIVAMGLPTALFFLIGAVSYQYNKPEHNGKFLIFRWFERAVQAIIVVLVSLVAGNAAWETIYIFDDRFTYAVGFAIGCALSLLVTSRLKRMHWRG